MVEQLLRYDRFLSNARTWSISLSQHAMKPFALLAKRRNASAMPKPQSHCCTAFSGSSKPEPVRFESHGDIPSTRR